MTWTPINNHLQQALNRLLEQYKNKALIQGLITGPVEQIQSIEDVFNAITTQTNINDSVGKQLDGIGEIVGIARTIGQSDDDYRIDIKAKIVQNLNQGTPEEIIAAAKFFINSDSAYFREIFPAGIGLFTAEEIANQNLDKIREKIQSFLPATVSLDELGVEDEQKPLRFDELPGFGDVNDPSVGGLFANLYTVSAFALLLENGGYLLLEDGSKLLLG